MMILYVYLALVTAGRTAIGLVIWWVCSIGG